MMKIHSTSRLRLCTQLDIYLLADFVHTWYVGWACCHNVHTIPISQMVNFCRSNGPL